MAISETKGQGGELSPPRKGRPAIYSTQPWLPFCSAGTQKGKEINRFI